MDASTNRDRGSDRAEHEVADAGEKGTAYTPGDTKDGITSDSVADHIEIVGVDAATEKRLLRALDIRIIPVVVWIYLMNMMDRGKAKGSLP